MAGKANGCERVRKAQIEATVAELVARRDAKGSKFLAREGLVRFLLSEDFRMGTPADTRSGVAGFEARQDAVLYVLTDDDATIGKSASVTATSVATWVRLNLSAEYPDRVARAMIRPTADGRIGVWRRY